MADLVLCEHEDLTAVADAIRNQTGQTEGMTLASMPSAINSIKAEVINVDSELSTTSENPVQNKIITERINTLSNEKVDKTGASLGIAPDGLTYLFVDDSPVGTGIPQGQPGVQVKDLPNSVWYEEEKHILVDNVVLSEDQIPWEDMATNFMLEDGDNVTVIYNGVVCEFNNISRNDERDDLWYNREDEFWMFYLWDFGINYHVSYDESKQSGRPIYIYFENFEEGDTFSFIVTRGAVKTNCDFFIKVPIEGDPILVQGDYATAKAKIEKGLPVVCYYIDILEYEGTIETYTGFSYVALYVNDEEETLGVNAGDNWVKIYSDGTVLRD
jgi:hypothetical protein